jgi:hypothetical protein
MATGIAVSGCGLGAFILAPLFQLINNKNTYIKEKPSQGNTLNRYILDHSSVT